MKYNSKSPRPTLLGAARVIDGEAYVPLDTALRFCEDAYLAGWQEADKRAQKALSDIGWVISPDRMGQ